MKYTDGEKGEITEPSKMLSDCVFLKRGFKWHKDMETVVGPLSLNTLVNSLRYKDSSRDYDDIMGGKLTAFQFEIFLHENENLKNKVLNAAGESSFYFKFFDDEHIKKTMKQEDTYGEVMRCLGKNISNFL
jgi:aldehyde:ferredoxin oxidoreductase